MPEKKIITLNITHEDLDRGYIEFKVSATDPVVAKNIKPSDLFKKISLTFGDGLNLQTDEKAIIDDMFSINRDAQEITPCYKANTDATISDLYPSLNDPTHVSTLNSALSYVSAGKSPVDEPPSL